MFTKDEYVDWRTSKVTRTLITKAIENRKGRLEEIGDGKAEGTALYIEIGITQGIRDTIEFLLNTNGELAELLIEEPTDGAIPEEA